MGTKQQTKIEWFIESLRSASQEDGWPIGVCVT
jgi:hypothetical protein